MSEGESQVGDLLVAVVGATASGKSDLAVDLALRLDGEVVNTDSMQLYRGMDIGTAKLSVAERRGVPHHLLDVLDVTQAASVAQVQCWARQAVRDVWSRGRVPILAGGSGLYLRAVIDDIVFPGTDAAIRARLEAQLDEVGAPAMHERLRRVDPDAAAAILSTNARRIVRALEVVELTGRPFAATLPEPTPWHRPVVQVAIDVSRDELDQRVEARVDRMWQRGLVDEVRALEQRGLRDGPTASRALGYAQVLRYLAGEWAQQQARERTVSATRRFIRRQDQWFRKDARVHWLPGHAVDAESTAQWLRSIRRGDAGALT
ncbi:MAG: tRNA (adenosine(37)-N6)-dimethylallyltransferase MiaA [Jiangellales bacterium]